MLEDKKRRKFMLMVYSIPIVAFFAAVLVISVFVVMPQVGGSQSSEPVLEPAAVNQVRRIEVLPPIANTDRFVPLR